uniref:NADAR domain-containing protein n=1 Tax=Chromera velia CCMP2878 TaxID=1169474 RepID=A0A0G4FDJ1_9ALVE|eukprot:Cvel_16359.t1-p1 / transcript=Cvel_16359.t1 / gene=Cvel_16359 / organism=Chromera_velia_CCMP2878 / gene_product=hypothetical protein / transcript_product=hypothetical protein / location=Cvel_scaffold1256:42771-43496(-) / protein_length=242 / sequence_SO=supercontig / SO=protein_coding / is_pseudo=false
MDGSGKSISPGTDNFEIMEFEMEGQTFYSSEQAYQAMKQKTDADRTKIAQQKPKEGENGWTFGMRVWNMGQRGARRANFEADKVEVMYEANKAKLMGSGVTNKEARKALIESKGEITHRGSGAFWDKWNPILLMRLREELKSDDDPSKDLTRLKSLTDQMDKYRSSSSSGHKGAGASSSSSPQKPSVQAGEGGFEEGKLIVGGQTGETVTGDAPTTPAKPDEVNKDNEKLSVEPAESLAENT